MNTNTMKQMIKMHNWVDIAFCSEQRNGTRNEMFALHATSLILVIDTNYGLSHSHLTTHQASLLSTKLGMSQNTNYCDTLFPLPRRGRILKPHKKSDKTYIHMQKEEPLISFFDVRAIIQQTKYLPCTQVQVWFWHLIQLPLTPTRSDFRVQSQE